MSFEETTKPFSSTPSEFPETLPVLALEGVVLLPGARLPLNIVEHSLMPLIDDALSKKRMIAIIQPQKQDDALASLPKLYDIGCAGQITSFSETEDGRILLQLKGICRFKIKEDNLDPDGLRRITPDWQPFLQDLRHQEKDAFDRTTLFNALRPYLKTQGITADWQAIEETENDTLVASLAMICEFEPNEKQALIEAEDLESRSKLLQALLEMACLRHQDPEDSRH